MYFFAKMSNQNKNENTQSKGTSQSYFDKITFQPINFISAHLPYFKENQGGHVHISGQLENEILRCFQETDGLICS